MRLRFPGRFLFIILAIAAVTGLLPGQETARKPPDPLSEDNLMAVMHSISTLTLYGYVRDLSSEKYEGRLTGTPGYNKAAQWAADLFKSWNIKARRG